MKELIESAWEERGNLSPANATLELRQAVDECLDGLETARFRVAESLGAPGEWKVNK